MTEGRGQAKPDGAENLSHQALRKSGLNKLIVLGGEQIAKEKKRTWTFHTPCHICLLVVLSGGFHLVDTRLAAQSFQQYLRSNLSLLIEPYELLNC